MKILQIATPTAIKLGLTYYPPYWFTGIKVDSVSAHWRDVRVSMALRWYNRNISGTQFGGSLFAMTDPFYPLMLAKILGPSYHIWDQKASIEFVAPGRNRVYADFHLDDATLDEIRQRTAGGEKYLPTFAISIVDAQGQCIAQLQKTVYVRRRKEFRPS